MPELSKVPHGNISVENFNIDTAHIGKVKEYLKQNGINGDEVAERIRTNFFNEMKGISK